MPEPTLTNRVENLERKTELLEALPARVSAVELQIVQLRTEMGEQFSAVRLEFRTELETVRTELRAEVRDGDEATRRFMRVLHEEVLSRIATLQEAFPRRRKR